MFRRFAKFFSVYFEFQMHLLKMFLNFCDWFIQYKSGINCLGIKTKLTLICNNANTVFLKVFIEFFLKFLSNNMLFYASYLGPTGLIYLQSMLYLWRNQIIDLFGLVKCIKSDIEKNCLRKILITT